MGGTEAPFTPNTGNRFANFLLGSVASAQFTRPAAQWKPRWWGHAFYVQDDFRPARNLTLNPACAGPTVAIPDAEGGQFDRMPPILRGVRAPSFITGPLARKDLNNWQPRLGQLELPPELGVSPSFTIITPI
jgi:hypothetical protein